MIDNDVDLDGPMSPSNLPDGIEYRVHYFDGYARGEAIRMLLSHAKIPFEDRRI